MSSNRLDSAIRWLHLSDFHVGKDGYSQSQLFKYILRHIEEKPKPDFVFITGDIAQSGKVEQYERFEEEFLEKFRTVVGEQCKIFAVPGNHDVDRQKEEFVTRDAIRKKTANFFDPDENGQVKRQILLSRFQAYAECDQLYLESDDWLASPHASFSHNIDIKGVRLGILGLNTAWFAEDGYDKGQLTPGKLVVERGLENIAESDIKIVLGHHPLDWFDADDVEGIRALFGKHHVIYLHGHLHRSRSRYEEGGGRLFLNVQGGAAFQAKENEKWVNGLMWGEWCQSKQCLELEPYCWNVQHQEWSPDTSVFSNAYQIGDSTRFALSFYGGQPIAEKSGDVSRLKTEKDFTAPKGWDVITSESIDKFDTEPDDSVILSYFDGRTPNFGLALCPKIPRRSIVRVVEKRLNTASKGECPTINMILGAGGEGKTTAFLQIIESLLKSGESWRVIYRRGDGASLSKKMVDDMPKDGQNWLIASDDADLIADDVYRIAFALQSEGRGDVHFLLSARFADWRNTKVSPAQWMRIAGYHEEELRNISYEDAVRIVEAWSLYDEKGLGRLAGLEKESAVEKLVAESRLEKSQDEGAFLGALLRLRFGDQLKKHVKKILDRLNNLPIYPGNPNSLLEAFAYIAAMHAENKLFLSKDVLAKVLNVSDRATLRSKVLYPLGKEAAADVTPEMVFTRHRAIAEAAISILATDTYYGVELDDLYVNLVGAAEELYHEGCFITNLTGWRYLSDHFFEKGNLSLAIRLAQALLNAAGTDPYFRVKLAHLFRKAGQPEQALRIFREAPMTELRGFFHEWSVGEGAEGNHALSVWLEAVDLADDTARKPPDNKQTAMSLAGFGVACRELFQAYNKGIFIEACGAAGQLGANLQGLNAKDEKYFLMYREYAASHGVSKLSVTAALRLIKEAAIAAYLQRETDLPEWIPPAMDLSFTGLGDLLGVDN